MPAAGFIFDPAIDEPVCGVVDGIQVHLAACDLAISLGFDIRFHAWESARVIGVIMDLMNGQDLGACIHDRHSNRTSLPDQPMVPVDPAHGKRRYIVIQAAGEYEIIDCIRELRLAGAHRKIPKLPLPTRGFETKRTSHGRVPARSHPTEWPR